MRRQRYAQRRGGGGGSLLLVGILILAVAVGYAGTKYFIAPYILEGKLWESQSDGENVQGIGSDDGTEVTSGPGIVSGQQDIKDADKTPTESAVKTTDVAITVTPPAAVIAPAPAPQSVLTGKFAVQFGSFSSKEAADKAVSEFAAKNITTSVLQKGDTFKVIGAPFDTKEQAKTEADRLRAIVEDIYVTAI